MDKGEHKIEIKPVLTLNPIIWNFENESELDRWRVNAQNIHKISLDKKAYKGNYGLKAELYNSTWGWKTISSPLIPAEYRTKYKLEFYVSGENAHKVHAKIVEYDSNKKIIKDNYKGSIGDGTFNWKNIILDFSPTSINTSYIRLTIWHGHNTDKPLPNKVWIDDMKIYGYKTSYIDVMYLYSTQKDNETLEDIFTPKETPAKVISYKKINPTMYIVQVNATKPFMLAFAESYDPLWIANINGENIRSVPLYSVINGFWINKTGEFEITIEYVPQKWFYVGLVITILSLIGSVGIVIKEWKKDKK